MFGPATKSMLLVVKTTPSENGNFEPFWLKYPMSFALPKLFPDDEVILDTLAQVVPRKTFSINCWFV